MSSPALDSYLDELLAEPPAAAEQAAAIAAAMSLAPVMPSAPSAAPPVTARARVEPDADSPSPLPIPARSPRASEAAPSHSAPASQRWLRVALGRDRYAFELLRVQEVVRMAPILAMRGADPAVLGVMNLRGRIVPVFDLGCWLGGSKVQVGERARIVVVERNDELIGVLVADVEDVTSLGREHIEPPLPGSAGGALGDVIVGIARVGKTPMVLLDANALFE